MTTPLAWSTLSAETRSKFIAEAARKATLKSGKGYAAAEVHAYLKRRIASKKASRSKAKAWRA